MLMGLSLYCMHILHAFALLLAFGTISSNPLKSAPHCWLLWCGRYNAQHDNLIMQCCSRMKNSLP